MGLFGDKMNLRGAAAGMLLGAVTLSACLGGCSDEVWTIAPRSPTVHRAGNPT